MTDVEKTLRCVLETIEQAGACIRGETPEDMSEEAAREDTLVKLKQADVLVYALLQDAKAGRMG